MQAFQQGQLKPGFAPFCKILTTALLWLGYLFITIKQLFPISSGDQRV